MRAGVGATWLVAQDRRRRAAVRDLGPPDASAMDDALWRRGNARDLPRKPIALNSNEGAARSLGCEADMTIGDLGPVLKISS